MSARYVSQGLTPEYRLQRRAERIYQRLGGEDDEGLIHKPKWMRWKTFNRLMDRAHTLAEAADEVFVYRAARLFAPHLLK